MYIRKMVTVLPILDVIFKFFLNNMPKQRKSLQTKEIVQKFSRFCVGFDVFFSTAEFQTEPASPFILFDMILAQAHTSISLVCIFR